MRERRVLWVVLAGFVVGLVAVAGLAAVDDGSSGGPPRLPALAATAGDAAESTAAGGSPAADTSMRVGPVEYRVAGDLPALPDRAPAFDVGSDVDADDVRRLATRLGVDGDIDADEHGWRVFDGARLLHVSRMAGAPWNLSTAASCAAMAVVSPDGRTAPPVEPELQPDGSCTAAGSSGSGVAGSSPGSAGAEAEIAEREKVAAGGDDAVSSSDAASTPPAPPGTSVEPCPMPDCPPGAACIQMCPQPTPEPAPLPEPERPADLPSKQEAERIGMAFLSEAGLDVDGADVRVDDGFSVWNVSAEPRVGGLPTQGMGWSVAVGPKGEIQYANGWLADPTRGDDYPLAGVQAGIERLKSGGGGWSPYPAADLALVDPAPECVGCEPVVRTVTGVRLGLMFSPVFTRDGLPRDAVLVPSYFFSFDDTDFEQPVVAVADEYLPPPPDVDPQPEPMPVEPDGGAGATEPARPEDADPRG